MIQNNLIRNEYWYNDICQLNIMIFLELKRRKTVGSVYFLKLEKIMWKYEFDEVVGYKVRLINYITRNNAASFFWIAFCTYVAANFNSN